MCGGLDRLALSKVRQYMFVCVCSYYLYVPMRALVPSVIYRPWLWVYFETESRGITRKKEELQSVVAVLP